MHCSPYSALPTACGLSSSRHCCTFGVSAARSCRTSCESPLHCSPYSALPTFILAQFFPALLHFRSQRREELPHLLRIAHFPKSVQRVTDVLRAQFFLALL